ncbi:MAG: SdrD B-like domain-containing protein [Clostridia bacterium]
MHYFGSYLGSGLISYATDEEDEVTFDAKIIDEEGKEIKEADITSELNLHLSISAKDGTLKNVSLNFDNCNFKLKDEFNIEQINAGENKELDLKIVARNDDKFNLDLLNMESKIKLTGTYLSDNKTEELNKEKAVSIKWNSANTYNWSNDEGKENKILEQEIITNKVYTIAGEKKRIIQIKVNSGIKNNIYPIEKTLITLSPLEIGKIETQTVDGVEKNEFVKESAIEAEKVEVTAYSTMATNGKDGSIDFGTIEEDKLGSWQYSNENGTTIAVNNNKDENNNIAWAKNAIDEFIVTYTIKETEELKKAFEEKDVITTASSILKLYTDEQELGKRTNWISISAEEKANPIELSVQATQEISKKNLKTGVNFKEALTLNISSLQIGNEIVLNLKDALSNEENEQEISTYYNTMNISVDEFKNILGEDGTITVLDNEGNAIKTITYNKEKNELEGLESEQENLKNIKSIKISKPVKGGKITLIVDKIVKYEEDAKYINSLSLYANAKIEEDIYLTQDEKAVTALKEPETKVELGIDLGSEDKKTLPIGKTNKVEFTVTLLTQNDLCKLFKNPTITIELPENVKIAQEEIKKEDMTIQHANGLEIEVVNKIQDGIEIKLKGSQEEYSEFDGQNTQIVFTVDLSTPELLPTFVGEFKLSVNNGEEKAEAKTAPIEFSAEKGFLLANSISEYNGTEPEIVAFKNQSESGLLSEENSALPQVKGTIINNTGKDAENVLVVGNFTGEDSTITPVLKEQIAVENATVEYSADGQTWEEYNEEKANTYKNYKMTFAKLADKSITTFTYKIEIPANLGANKSMSSTYALAIDGEKEPVKAPTIVLETPQKIELEVVAKATSDTIYEGQEISFTVDVTNKSNAKAKNVSIEVAIPEELELTSQVENFDIEAGKTVTKTIMAKVKELPDETKQKDITTIIRVTPNGKEEQAKTAEVKNTVKQALITAKIEDAYSDGAEFIYEGGQLGYETTITNVSDETLTDVVIVSKLPEGTKLNESKEIMAYLFKIDNKGTKDKEVIRSIEIENNNGELRYSVPEFQPGQEIKTIIYLTQTDPLSENVYEKKVKYSVQITAEQIKEYIVEKEDFIVKPKIDLEVTSENLTDIARDKYVKEGDVIEYTAKIKNESNQTHEILFQIYEIENLEVGKINLKKYDNKGKELGNTLNDSINKTEELKSGEQLIATWKGIVSRADLDDKIISSTTSVTVKNPVRDYGEIKSMEPRTQTIEYILKGTKTDDPDTPVDPDPENPDAPTEKTYSISGTAWLDENEDGIKDEKEKLLKGILVKIKQINEDNVAEYLKNEAGEEITAITDNEGKYEFKDLKTGKYIVEFEYNTKTYKLTPVINKDSVPSAPTTSEGTTVKTDTLNLNNENIENINIGLVLNEKFDLELNKYITKVTVQNNSGITEYSYNNEQLAKVEIKAKQMEGSTVFVEYQLELKNNGAVPGTASVIADYLPKGLKFSSEMNTNWYQGTDGNLYTEELKDVTLEPGETKQVKLILTKTMTANNTGTFTNAAEIYEDKNEFGLVDTNSTPANQEQKENDYSKAELLISTATGSPVMYIGIVITSMLILGGRNIPNK